MRSFSYHLSPYISCIYPPHLSIVLKRTIIFLSMIGLLGIMTITCDRPVRPLVGLFDQVPENESAGPWRVILQAHHPNEMLHLTSGMESGDSKLRLSTDSAVLSIKNAVIKNERVFAYIQFRQPPDSSLRFRLQFLQGTSPLKTQVMKITSKMASGSIRIPESCEGIFTVDIRGTHGVQIPIQSLTIAVLDTSAGKGSVARLRTLIKTQTGNYERHPRGMLTQTKYSMVAGKIRRSCIALTSDDTLAFAVPPSAVSSYLRFWILPSITYGHAKDTLIIEARIQDTLWHTESCAIKATSPNQWISWEDVCRIPAGCDSIRFRTCNNQMTIHLAEPILSDSHSEESNRLNLILIDLDTLRSDRLGAYGYTRRQTSPHLDSLLSAKGFYLFTHAFSPGAWTLTSTAKFLTSRYGKVQTKSSLPYRYDTLAEYLRREGYYCTAFTGAGVLEFPGFEQGFHEYSCDGVPIGKVEHSFPSATDWLNENTHNPFFLFIHTYETHMPYTRDIFCRNLPHGRLGNISRGEIIRPHGHLVRPNLSSAESMYIEAAYDGGVRVATDAVARLFGEMDHLGLWKNTVVIILSDHGEEFWDHHNTYARHGHSLYGEIINIPFILYSPMHPWDGIRYVNRWISLVDLVPTCLDILSIDTDARFDGESIVPFLLGNSIDRRTPILSVRRDNIRDTKSPIPFSICVLENGSKLIRNVIDSTQILTRDGTILLNRKSDLELYDIRVDPRERDNLTEAFPSLAESLETLFHSAEHTIVDPIFKGEKTRREEVLSQDAYEKLRALGYIDSR